MEHHQVLRALAKDQQQLVARWQLAACGWLPRRLELIAARYESVLDGVYLIDQAQAPTRMQRMRAATLSAPQTYLSQASAGALYEIYDSPENFITVMRPGNGGPRRVGPLLVTYRTTVLRHVTSYKGIPVVTVERTNIDLAPHLSPVAQGRMLRESIRLRCTTAARVVSTLDRCPRAVGVDGLRAVAAKYVHLPIQRCKSDAEARGLEIFDDAGAVIPAVNRYVAGEEADYWWPELGLIIEIDGPNFHLFRDEDARKTAKWRGAGLEVRRISSDDVYAHPALLLALYSEWVARRSVA